MPTHAASGNDRGPATAAADAAEQFVWRAHPAAERPAHAMLAVLVITVLMGLVYLASESAWMTALGGLLLVGALNRFFLPSRFVIDEEGITARYPLRRMRCRWTELQRFVWDERGGYLSRRAAPSRLDAYRGMHLIFHPADRQRAIERINDRMARQR